MNEQQRERIYRAKAAGLKSRIAIAVGDDRAEELMALWEAEAGARGLSRDSPPFWAEVEPWMARAATLPVRR